MKRNILLLSNSTVQGSSFLEWAADFIKEFLSGLQVEQVLFVPYALKNHDSYTETVQKALSKLGFEVKGIHAYENPISAIQDAQAIFIGGGNTFRLLKNLYDLKLIEPIKERILQNGIPYIGISAGTNVSTLSICTTNDMPIVYPPSFEALSLVPFNINPHYTNPPADSSHMGETRELRIKEYHEENTHTVVGLREGSLLHVTNDSIKLQGNHSARIFVRDKEPVEYETGSDLSFLLKV